MDKKFQDQFNREIKKWDRAIEMLEIIKDELDDFIKKHDYHAEGN